MRKVTPIKSVFPPRSRMQFQARVEVDTSADPFPDPYHPDSRVSTDFEVDSVEEEEPISADEAMELKYYSKRIRHASLSQDMAEAEKAFTEMEAKGVVPNSFTYVSIMQGYYLTKDMDSVFDWYRKMREAKIEASTHVECMLLAGCATKGDLKRAIQVLFEFRDLGIEPDTAGMNALMRTCLKAGSLQTALKVLKEMDNRNMQKTVITYNTLLDGYIELNPFDSEDALVQKGFEIKRQITESGLKCDIQTYNTLIKMCLAVHYTQTAQSLFQEIRQEGLQPNIITYSMMIDGYAKNGKQIPTRELFDCCAQLLDDMEAEGIYPNTHTFNSLLKVCTETGNYSRAKEIAAVMEKRGVPWDIFTYGTLIDCCAKYSPERNRRQYLRDCFYYAHLLVERGFQLNCKIISALLIACACAKDLRSGEKLMDYMEEEGIEPNVVVYTSFIKVYLSVDDEIGALECMKEMNKRGIPPNVHTYNALIKWYVYANQQHRVFETIAAMKRRNIEPNSCTKHLARRFRQRI